MEPDPVEPVELEQPVDLRDLESPNSFAAVLRAKEETVGPESVDDVASAWAALPGRKPPRLRGVDSPKDDSQDGLTVSDVKEGASKNT